MHLKTKLGSRSGNILQKKILIGALDWGLGHASRCVPIIQLLLDCGSEPVIASSGGALNLLKAEFPGLQSLELPKYHIKYPSGRWLILKLASQLPGIRKTFLEENKVLSQIIKKENIGAVISDNRYGLYNKQIPSIFMTHQLFIKSPSGFSFVDPIVAKLNFSFIKRFNECWIPDYEDEPTLSGELSHGKVLPCNCYYIGPLSRLNNQNGNTIKKTTGEILVILSGPEPQRSLLEQKLISQFNSNKGKITCIRGLFNGEQIIEPKANITFVSHATKTELIEYINKAELIICRSGYSSIMDLAKLSKKAILIPTPGQTEQEYLAKYHYKAGNYDTQSQEKLDFKHIKLDTISYTGLISRPATSLLKERIELLIGKL